MSVLLYIALNSSESRADLQASTWTGSIGSTSAGSAQYRTWAVSSNGNILSRKDVPVSAGTSTWSDLGAGSAHALPQGVSATGFTNGADIYEVVVYVGTDGNLNIGQILNGGAITWFAFAPPPGHSLTGNTAITTFVSGGLRNFMVGATTNDSSLFRYVGLVGLSYSGSWSNSSGSLPWTTNTPLAASTSPDDTTPTIAGTQANGSDSNLAILRWNPSISAYVTTNLGRPAGKEPCRSLAIAQGNLSGLAGGERVVIACTPGNNIAELYLAGAAGYNSTTFTWTTYTNSTSTWYQSVAAVTHPTSIFGLSKVIDIYMTSVLDNRIQKGVLSSSTFAITDLMFTPDGGSVLGGITAVPYGSTASRMYFVNSLNGRTYLYERYGGSTTNNPANYRALGDEHPDELSVSSFYAEGKVSTFQGTMAASVISRPGLGTATDWPSVVFLYSPDDGDALQPPQQIPNVVAGVTYKYVSDPTTVVTDQRMMYSFQIGVDLTTCSLSTVHQAAVYAVTTTPATFPTFSSPLLLEHATGTDNNGPFDHPYADIQHVAGGADLIHVAWWSISGQGPNPGIHYEALPEGGTPLVTPKNLQFATINGITFSGPPRLTASDSGRVIVYYGSNGNVFICEINPTHDGCVIPTGATSGWQVLPTTLNFQSPAGMGNNDLGPGISGSDIHIRADDPLSMAVSETGDKLYYCFTRLETNGDSTTDGDTREETDAFCSTATRDPSTAMWVWVTTPVSISGVTNDDKDQFAPEVVLTREQVGYLAGQETAIVTYYDRADDPANFHYVAKKTVSTDRGASFYPPRAMFAGASSDPSSLPRHCRDSTTRFIGDYSGSEGDVDHAFSLEVLALTPGTTGTTLKSNFAGLGRWDR